MSELLEALKEVRDRVTWATELSLKTICDEGKKKRKQFVLKLKKKKTIWSRSIWKIPLPSF